MLLPSPLGLGYPEGGAYGVVPLEAGRQSHALLDVVNVRVGSDTVQEEGPEQ